MRLIFEEYLDLKSKESTPNRKINYVNIKSNLYKTILRQKSSNKNVSDNTWHKDSSFVIEPLYASLKKDHVKIRNIRSTNVFISYTEFCIFD